MAKDKKESRLSFRITPELSEDIDGSIKELDTIKDRSDFGTKAVKYYLSYLKEENNIREVIQNAILALSQNIDGEELAEIKKLKKVLEGSR